MRPDTTTSSRPAAVTRCPILHADYRLRMSDTPAFVDDHHLRIGETDFYCAFPFDDAPEGYLQVMKGRELVERYIALIQELRPRVAVELGIRRGGSTALLSELIKPDKLIALELTSRPAPALRDYVASRDLAEVVRPFYGVDQSDRPRVSQILDEELGARPIDLVVDDASHLYAETRSSFEVLFPRVRPGGRFVIEDWNGRHLLADRMAHALEDTTRPDHDQLEQRVETAYGAQLAEAGHREIPLTQLCIEFMLARASNGDAIREVLVNRHWVVIERGADPLDPERFRLSNHVNDHFGFTNAAS